VIVFLVGLSIVIVTACLMWMEHERKRDVPWRLPGPLRRRHEALTTHHVATLYEEFARADPRWAEIAQAYRQRSDELRGRYLE